MSVSNGWLLNVGCKAVRQLECLSRGQWGEPYGLTVRKKRDVLIIHSFIHSVAVQEGEYGCPQQV
jgi:hypothetical protein